jgi:hypothetical protein
VFTSNSENPTVIKIASSFALCFYLLAGTTALQAQHYSQMILIDSKMLKVKSKRDTFRVGTYSGKYSGISVETVGANNIIKRVTVRFEDDSSQVINDSQLKFKNQRTDIIWFRTGSQAVEKVSILYDPDVPINEGAEIKLYGVR